MVSSQTTPLSIKKSNNIHVTYNKIPYIGLNFMPI